MTFLYILKKNIVLCLQIFDWFNDYYVKKYTEYILAPSYTGIFTQKEFIDKIRYNFVLKTTSMASSKCWRCNNFMWMSHLCVYKVAKPHSPAHSWINKDDPRVIPHENFQMNWVKRHHYIALLTKWLRL